MPSLRRIWVVDDSASEAERARQALESEYDVRVLRDGSAALEALGHDAPPDLLLLDWVMPGVSGLEVCRLLRSLGDERARIGVLLLTARGSGGSVAEGLRAGANDYLSKPYSDDELKARVETILGARDLLARAERAEALARRLLASSPDALLHVDAAGLVTYANEEAARAFDQPADRLVGRRLVELAPALTPEAVQAAGRALFPLADVEVHGRLHAPTVRLTGDEAVVALRDVTDRRELEERRLEFYTVVAHDLRTPLSSILLRSELVLSGKRGLVPARVQVDVERIDASARSLLAMLNDFLELARIQSSPFALEREELELGALVEGVVKDLQPLADAAGLTYRFRPGGPAPVHGDPRRLAQVVSNLLGNALKFTAPGGSVDVSLEAGQGAVEVSVRDTGRGIAAEALPRIFDRYVRASQRGDAAVGSGLGLMIVRDAVRAHGGAVGVESEPGRGSRFWFRLPLLPRGAR